MIINFASSRVRDRNKERRKIERQREKHTTRVARRMGWQTGFALFPVRINEETVVWLQKYSYLWRNPEDLHDFYQHRTTPQDAVARELKYGGIEEDHWRIKEDLPDYKKEWWQL